MVNRIFSAASKGGVNSYACTRGILRALTGKYDEHFLFSKTGFSGNAGLMTHKIADSEVLSTLGPNAALFDRLTYPYDINPLTTDSLTKLDESLTVLATNKATCVRQILIYLSLLNMARL